MSTLSPGQRHIGNTEIFKRFVNRLFFKQDPNDPDAVVPVYYSFPDNGLDTKQFALQYTDDDFSQRMFTYFYRIFNKYQRNIVALAIFTKEHY
jgi:hypothetical protein